MLRHKIQLIYLIFLFYSVLGIGVIGYAQNYPVQITSQLIPPFSGYISDYRTPGNQQLKLLVLFNDFSKPSYTIKIKINISGQSINIRSKSYFYAGPFTIQPGIPMEISGGDFSELLDTRNLDFSGISVSEYEKRKLLPEGYYNICFTAYDYNNPTPIQVSNESCAFGWMVLSDPPFLNTPLCESVIKPIDPQNIFFQWTPMNLTSPNSANSTVYDFELYEVKPSTQNPGNVIQTLPPIYRTTTSLPFVNYGITEPQLYAGTRYVWRVRARDEGNRDLFKNKGYSQQCIFKYGDKLSQLDSNSLKLNLKGRALNYRLINYSWDSLNIFSAYRLEYRKKGGVNWFPVNTITSGAIASRLEAENTYEARVKGVLTEGEGPWSDIVVIKTLAKPIIACGQQLLTASPANFKPHPFGKAGQFWDIGQFEMVVTDLKFSNNPTGLYSGYGTIEIPFLGGLNLIAQFNSILVNDELAMAKGRVDVIRGGIDDGNILDLDSLFKDIDKWFDDLVKTKDTAAFKDKITSYKDLICSKTNGEPLELCSLKDEDAIALIANGKSSTLNSIIKAGAVAYTKVMNVCSFDAGEKYFIAPNGKVFQMPKGAKASTTISAKADGAVYGFKIDGKYYEADVPTPGSLNYFEGFKNSGIAYKAINYTKQASKVHVLLSDNKAVKIYTVVDYKAPENAYDDNQNGVENNNHIIENQAAFDQKFFLCNCSANSPPDITADELFEKVKSQKVSTNTFIYKDGTLIKLVPNKSAEKVSCNAKQLAKVKENISNGEFNEASAVLFEKTILGFKTSIGFNNKLQPKYGSSSVKQECAEILEEKTTAFLKNAKDLTTSVKMEDDGEFTDGKKFEFNIDQNYCTLISNLVHDAATFIQEAKIPESYYNSKGDGYSTNWIHSPPLPTGVANGAIETVKDIPVLVAFGADIAMNANTRHQLKEGLKKLNSWKNIKLVASKVVTNWTDKYSNGGDVAWHQAGKDGVGIYCGAKAFAAIAVSFRKGIEKEVDEIAEEVEKEVGEEVVQGAGKIIPKSVEEIKHLLVTDNGKSFFWSGKTSGIGGEVKALEIAHTKGGITLEGLLKDKNIELPAWNPSDPTVMKLWEDVSAEYAKQVSGEVRAVIGQDLRPGNIWQSKELPALMLNTNVTKITTIDPVTLIETVIFNR